MAAEAALNEQKPKSVKKEETEEKRIADIKNAIFELSSKHGKSFCKYPIPKDDPTEKNPKKIESTTKMAIVPDLLVKYSYVTEALREYAPLVASEVKAALGAAFDAFHAQWKIPSVDRESYVDTMTIRVRTIVCKTLEAEKKAVPPKWTNQLPWRKASVAAVTRDEDGTVVEPSAEDMFKAEHTFFKIRYCDELKLAIRTRDNEPDQPSLPHRGHARPNFGRQGRRSLVRRFHVRT
jgi:hypothetical protein